MTYNAMKQAINSLLYYSIVRVFYNYSSNMHIDLDWFIWFIYIYIYMAALCEIFIAADEVVL